MPLFEYVCQECLTRFESFVTRDRVPECPSCHGTSLQKQLSSPGMVGAGSGRETEAFPSCGAQGGSCACRNQFAN
jgi:putative FmdB family regulatory protein